MDLTFMQVQKLTELWQAEDGQDLVARLLTFLAKMLIDLNKQRQPVTAIASVFGCTGCASFSL